MASGSTGPVSQIFFRQLALKNIYGIKRLNYSIDLGSPLAAVNSTNHLRVYSEDVHGSIRESMYEGKWTMGNNNNPIAKGKIGTPIAATSKELNEV